jgi:transposase
MDEEIMVGKRTKFSASFKVEAVKLVIEGSRPIAEVARELGINSGTLGNWVDRYRHDHPVTEVPLNVSERVRLKELEVENRELRMKNEFLGKAAAFFARESQ